LSVIQLSKVGLVRANFSEGDIRKLQTIFRKLFYQPGIFETKYAAIKNEYANFESANKIFEFARLSKRGIAICAKLNDQ
jgi:acyl-[acyl carrier protein]--UDP-N-acetylglucosamine O-acyltransferase